MAGFGRGVPGPLNAQGCKVVDTNVVVRLLVADDEAQGRVAESLLGDRLFVPLTVLLETVWVLSSRYRLDRAGIAESLRRLLDLPAIHVDDPELVRWAVDRFGRGADFSDMIHMISGRHGQAFLTFDRHLAKTAGDKSPLPVVTLGG